MMAALTIVTVDELGEERSVYCPQDALKTRVGAEVQLPTAFYRVNSREEMMETRLAPSFTLGEFLYVDLHEDPRASSFPRYVPCAISLLAAHLQVLRDEVDTYVHIAANGGYRTPSHALSTYASPHIWGTAANIYKIGSEYLDSEEDIRKYAEVVRRVLPHVNLRPYGKNVGEADDHLHLDLGFTRFPGVEREDSA